MKVLKIPYHSWLNRLNTSVGQRVLQREICCIQKALYLAHGNHLLLVGPAEYFKVVESYGTYAHYYQAECETLNKMLPFSNHSMDCIILVHTIDFVSEPVCLLKEAFRVLHPEGQLFVLGFYPRWYQHFFSFSKKSGLRLKPLLRCLKKEGLYSVSHGIYSLSPSSLFARIFSYLGLGYWVLSKKQEIGLIPQRKIQGWATSSASVVNTVLGRQSERSTQHEKY